MKKIVNKYKLNKGFIIQKLDRKITIFDGEQSALYTFNETASFVFAKIRSGWERERITEALIKKYRIDKKKAQEDFDDLTKDLLTKKIITQKTE